MNNDLIDDMRIDFLNMVADIELGKLNPQTLEKVKKAITRLTAEIDIMSDKKSETDYQIIELCLQYYRFRDLYENQPPS